MDYIHELRQQIGPRKIILNAATTIIEKDGKILLQRRTDNGKWGLIGGLMEMNETFQETAIREVLEETGLEVRLDSFLGIFHNHNMVWSSGDQAHVVTAFFTASIIGFWKRDWGRNMRNGSMGSLMKPPSSKSASCF